MFYLSASNFAARCRWRGAAANWNYLWSRPCCIYLTAAFIWYTHTAQCVLFPHMRSTRLSFRRGKKLTRPASLRWRRDVVADRGDSAGHTYYDTHKYIFTTKQTELASPHCPPLSCRSWHGHWPKRVTSIICGSVAMETLCVGPRNCQNVPKKDNS